MLAVCGNFQGLSEVREADTYSMDKCPPRKFNPRIAVHNWDPLCLGLTTGSGCRSVVDTSRDLTELASPPAKPTPEKVAKQRLASRRHGMLHPKDTERLLTLAHAAQHRSHARLKAHGEPLPGHHAVEQYAALLALAQKLAAFRIRNTGCHARTRALTRVEQTASEISEG